MALFVATTLLLVQISAFTTVTYSCSEYKSVDWSYCANKPTIYNYPATLWWNRFRYRRAVNATLDIRKVDNAWSQTGCFSLGSVSSVSYNVRASYKNYYTLPQHFVDYDSLYIARVWWANSTDTEFYIKDGDCYFTLQPTPLAPRNVAVAGATSSSITWIWDPPTNHGNKVTQYHLSNGASTTGTYYRWNGLLANRQYGISVRAVTGSGYDKHYGRWSSRKYHTTLPADPPSPSVSIDSRTVTARSVVLTLSGCTNVRVGRVKYIVRYSFDNGNELTAETATTQLTVKDLRPGKQYDFAIRCENSAGNTGPTVTRYATTLSEDTLQPIISSVWINDLSSTTITWSAPSAQVTVTEYDIRILPHARGIPQTPSAIMRNCPSYLTRCTLRMPQGTSLRPETVYTFQMRAQTSVGESQWSTPVVKSTLSAIPPRINGFTASSSTSTSFTLSWDQTTATIEYYRLTLHSVEANTTEHSDLFHTVNSHTFHNLRPSTAYSVTITAINKAGSGPTVSVNVTTQGAPVSPLAIATGALGAMVVMGMVAVPVLIGCTCCMWVSRKKGKDHDASDGNYNCELRENVAYVTAAHTQQWSEACCEMEEEEEKEKEGCEENNMCVNGKAIELEPVSPQVPCRQYLQEKERGQTMFASIPVFDEVDFKKKSGWYKPTVADVITGKLGMDVAVLADLGPGVYFMRHRTKKQAKWVGLSPDLCRSLCGLFFQLYQKKHSELSPLEVELKFFSPLAADWDIQVWSADPKELALERAKKIVEFKTLKPLGLNNGLKFTTKETWEEFIGWFAAQRRNK